MKVIIVKGEGYGHPFRGNQWSRSGGLEKGFWDKNDFNKTASFSVPKTDILPRGKIAVRLNGPKDGGKGDYNVYVETGGNVLVRAYQGKLSTKSDGVKLHGTAEDVAEQAMGLVRRHQEFIEKIVKQEYDRSRDDMAPISYLEELESDYHDNANPRTIAALVEYADNDYNLVGQYAISQNIKRELEFDADGMITLYRGGSDNGLSWSTKSDVAERFARYGFGGVPVQASGLVGIQAVMGGAESANITVHKRKFRQEDILDSITHYGEGEVLIRPSVLGIIVDTSILSEDYDEEGEL